MVDKLLSMVSFIKFIPMIALEHLNMSTELFGKIVMPEIALARKRTLRNNGGVMGKIWYFSSYRESLAFFRNMQNWIEFSVNT